MKSVAARAERTQRAAEDDGFTLIETLVALIIVAGVSAAFGLVLTVTSRFAIEDDVRGRASQIAAREVERMRTAPWTTAAVVSPSSSCENGELVRTTATPGVAQSTTEADANGRTFTIRNAITWVGVACGAPAPAYGRLRMLSRVSWTDSGKSRYTTTVNYRVPPADFPVPLATAAALSPSPSPTPTASASPTAGASASPTPSAAATTSPSPSPAASLPVPTFADFLPQPPKTFCSHNGKTVEAVNVSVNVLGINAGELITMTWGAPGESASATSGPVVNGKSALAFTMPAGRTAAIGALEFKITVPATGTHATSTHSETFDVYKAHDANRCRNK